MELRICIAGVTGWTGSAVGRAVLRSPGFALVSAVSRTAAGQDVGSALGEEDCGVLIYSTVEEALENGADVLIDYTHPEAVKGHVQSAISHGVSAVIGTSGLNGPDYAEIDELARQAKVGVVAAGNFSITAALAKHFAGIAARYIRHWELIDYAHGGKPDAPSGTVRELADFLGGVSQNQFEVQPDETVGERGTRGTTMGGAQVHSVRLPSYLISFEAIFGLPNERLTLRHDSGSGAEPYVNGTLLAAKKAVSKVGLVRGLDTLLFGGDA